MPPTPVLLYVTDTMADWECGHAIAHIQSPNWQRTPGRYAVTTVAAAAAPVTTMGGVRIVPDRTLAELQPGDAAMLILPGCETWPDAERHAEVIAHARARIAQERPVAAICGATFALAAAELLDERAHTSNAAMYLDSSGYAGGHLYREQPAVTDRGLITASGCFPVDFAAHIFAALALYEAPVLDAWHGLYTTGSPEHFAVLAAA